MPEDLRKKQDLVTKLETLLNQEWPGKDFTVHAFGSTENMLATRDSDCNHLCLYLHFQDTNELQWTYVSRPSGQGLSIAYASFQASWHAVSLRGISVRCRMLMNASD